MDISTNFVRVPLCKVPPNVSGDVHLVLDAGLVRHPIHAVLAHPFHPLQPNTLLPAIISTVVQRVLINIISYRGICFDYSDTVRFYIGFSSTCVVCAVCYQENGILKSTA